MGRVSWLLKEWLLAWSCLKIGSPLNNFGNLAKISSIIPVNNKKQEKCSYIIQRSSHSLYWTFVSSHAEKLVFIYENICSKKVRILYLLCENLVSVSENLVSICEDLSLLYTRILSRISSVKALCIQIHVDVFYCSNVFLCI